MGIQAHQVDAEMRTDLYKKLGLKMPNPAKVNAQKRDKAKKVAQK